MLNVLTLLTVDDVQALLPGLSTRAVKEELRRSGLAVRVRGKLYITAENFSRYLEAKQCRSTSNAAPASVRMGTVSNRRIRRSLKTRDRASAEILVSALEARLVRESVYGAENETTFADAALRYLADGRRRRYAAQLIRALGRRRLSTIKPGDIKQLAVELYPHAKPSTRNVSVIRPASAIINHAAELGLCAPIKIKGFAEAKVIRHAVDRAWIDAFRARASLRLGALALFMFTTGARLGDGVALAPEHVDLEAKRAALPRGKNGDPRVFYLTDDRGAERIAATARAVGARALSRVRVRFERRRDRCVECGLRARLDSRSHASRGRPAFVRNRGVDKTRD
jgi:integrase